jgi:hypothetical protein
VAKSEKENEEDEAKQGPMVQRAKFNEVEKTKTNHAKKAKCSIL